MAKVLQITSDYISIGTDDGTIKDVLPESFTYTPSVGDEVKVFQGQNGRIIVMKDDSKKPEQQQVVINNVNTNTNTVRVVHGREKNKWVAFFLCLLLGVIGAHKFYEGKVGMGILYIFTFGLAGVGVVIDLIAILLKPNPYYV